MRSEFPVSNAGLNSAFDFITDAIRQQGHDEGAAHRLSVILDELCANMIRHDETLSEKSRFSVELQLSGAEITMIVSDPGHPFDPISFQHEEVPEIGGHGISVVKGLSSAISYERRDGRNTLTIEIDPDT